MIKTGLTSVTFRKLDAEAVAALCAEAGLDGIEWGGDIHVPPGDFQKAEAAAAVCRTVGVRCLSYGSYFSADTSADAAADFARVADTADALGCRTVRIWGGKRAYADADEGYIAAFTDRMKRVADLCERRGMTACFEHHKGTLCDSAQNTRRLLALIGSPGIKTYWQPIETHADNLKAIEALKESIVNVHVYRWCGQDRLPLEDGAQDWLAYRKLLDKGDHAFLIEFVHGDDPDRFIEDARTLRKITGS